MRRAFLSAFAALLAFAAPAVAQTHAASVDALDAIATGHAGDVHSARTELAEFLARPDVRDVAAQAGLDIGTASSAVAALSDQEAADLAADARQIDAALAGGNTVVISTTAIIIGLLILIIILVA